MTYEMFNHYQPFQGLGGHSMNTHSAPQSYFAQTSSHQNDDLDSHVSSSVKKKKTHRCDVCLKVFYQKSHRDNHLTIHSADRPFNCQVCGKTFKRSDNLKAHLLVHSDDRPFVCNVCGRGFKQETLLKYHVLIHKEDKEFTCKVCNRGFARRVHLEDHLIVHSDERPFKCKYCSKTFKRLNNLHSHNLTHAIERPFTCSHCKKTFKSEKYLESHSRLHERPHKCAHCNKSFADQAKLRTHVSTKHAGETFLEPEPPPTNTNNKMPTKSKSKPKLRFPGSQGRSHMPKPSRLTGRHFVEYIPPTEKKTHPSRRCVVCYMKTDENGEHLRKETRTWCVDCNTALCVTPCFKIYHTIADLESYI